MQWDPAQYARFSDERSRPFFDLVGQIGAGSPGVVVDLGCGSGELTAVLASRWPAARVRGLDSSAAMIEQTVGGDRLSFGWGDAADFDAGGVDVLVSNALLQWVPGHQELLVRWAGQLNAGSWLAFGVPANFGSPSHRLMRELAGSDRWASRLAGVLRHADAVAEPAEYLELLVTAGLRVNAWQTSYLHVLSGPDPVLEWVRGTGLRPVLAALDASEAAEFVSEYGALLRQAYPARPFGTVFPFLRTFVVAHKPGEPSEGAR
ncbi:methyltransferase domain-containing protein [Jatrophihabitans sp.]|uniref:methyltransferase domain-containing protein n=1 Tax=Jatrophihabitans sp. TaxID=1932789 RepID=UPI002D0B3637|nr:methyltransferase domain-containing protein [Jatrophihabitans sp.]